MLSNDVALTWHFNRSKPCWIKRLEGNVKALFPLAFQSVLQSTPTQLVILSHFRALHLGGLCFGAHFSTQRCIACEVLTQEQGRASCQMVGTGGALELAFAFRYDPHRNQMPSRRHRPLILAVHQLSLHSQCLTCLSFSWRRLLCSKKSSKRTLVKWFCRSPCALQYMVESGKASIVGMV
jgi:hypothetical protein